VVEYDSIILPGREGTLTPAVDIKGVQGGQFKKTITVISDAENESTLRVSLGGTVKAVIDVSSRFVRLKAEGGQNNAVEITLSAEKSDLKIADVAFESQSGGAPTWQAELPLYVRYKLTRAEKPKKDGYYDYTLALWIQEPQKENRHGEFVMHTNYAAKDEIRMRGMIEVTKHD